MSTNSDEYLQHFGVLGMKWGRQKARFQAGGTTRRERNAAEARYQVQRSGGSKGKAIAKSLGKTIGIQVLAGAGTLGVSQIAGPRVTMGAARIATVFGLGQAGSGLADIVRIARS